MTLETARAVGWNVDLGKDDPHGPLRDALRKAGARPNRTLLLFDARMACYRMFHTRDLSAPAGEPTSVLHGLLGMVRAACEAAGSARFLLVWDGSVEYKRRVFPGYKIRHDRQLTEEEENDRVLLREHIRVARDFLDKFRFPQLLVPGIECDDAIGLCVSRAEGLSGLDRIAVVSDDKDFYQLASGKTLVWRAGQGKLVDGPGVESLTGLRPDQWADFKALVGESATGDNIPGVPGIGEKRGTKFIAACGDLEGAIAMAAAAVAGGKPQTIETSLYSHAEQARLSYKLARIIRSHEELVGEFGFSGPEAAGVDACVRAGLRGAISVPRPFDRVRALRELSRYGFSTAGDVVDGLRAFAGFSG